jgi:hypothetical protein
MAYRFQRAVQAISQYLNGRLPEVSAYFLPRKRLTNISIDWFRSLMESTEEAEVEGEDVEGEDVEGEDVDEADMDEADVDEADVDEADVDEDAVEVEGQEKPPIPLTATGRVSASFALDRRLIGIS